MNKKDIWDYIAGAIMGLIFCFMLAVFLTPEKTKSGQYTNFWQYWTNDSYYCENF